MTARAKKPRPLRPKADKTGGNVDKAGDKTKMIRVDDDVRAYIVKRAQWGESINTTLRRLLGLAVNGENQKAKAVK